jgi:DNA-binding PadR family transcriptional regulator
MLIDKHFLLIDGAIRKVSKRFDVPPLTRSHLFCLYIVKRSHLPPSSAFLLRKSKEYHYDAAENTIYKALRELVQYELLSLVDGKFSITPLGREYVNALRRYLLNKRL